MTSLKKIQMEKYHI